MHRLERGKPGTGGSTESLPRRLYQWPRQVAINSCRQNQNKKEGIHEKDYLGEQDWKEEGGKNDGSAELVKRQLGKAWE